ncbi:hypothetical protein Bca52824_064578 [Brassica carinata]|uniref:DUF1985 domain-containing protein n=1 Tax=Brassica carinata TaxID=52824 RepID=A0A8X7QHT8_BRACI|nr:hypothetical protein Bca52824_064578 [Brassica carinata]
MRKYPHRLYEVGKTPVQSRSMNHSCYLSNIQTVREELGDDVWSELRESAIGVIVKLKELPYIWYAKVVQHFLANQLAIESSHEIWSLIDDSMPLRFSLYEFGEIIGLNCDPFDKHDVWDVDHQEFWLEMNVPTSDGPTLLELQAIFRFAETGLEKLNDDWFVVSAIHWHIWHFKQQQNSFALC